MRLTACLGVMLSAACGPSYILLEVTSDLDIPSATDSLEIVLLEPEGDERTRVTQPLRADQAFPLTIGLQPGDSTPQPWLEVEITARLGTDDVAWSAAVFDWEEHVVNRVTLEPLRPTD